MSAPKQVEKFSSHEVRAIAAAMEKTGVHGAVFGLETKRPWLFYLPCGRPVFELALVAMREMADRLETEQRAVTVEWSDDRAAAPVASDDTAASAQNVYQAYVDWSMRRRERSRTAFGDALRRRASPFYLRFYHGLAERLRTLFAGLKARVIGER
ncbi:hypothetical protein [Methylosinus sp. Sm6]|uniref:hypothetical protein n=1 Tax=Methylosinus sp. Sm6 TaxID=2866948 RepID=UPI001C997B87|nr:hypothetical protein [Methylosinus sp. Sm6]MBY6239844.1 hypothetical protein [Methylosinus sp. Sm6]